MNNALHRSVWLINSLSDDVPPKERRYENLFCWFIFYFTFVITSATIFQIKWLNVRKPPSSLFWSFNPNFNAWAQSRKKKSKLPCGFFMCQTRGHKKAFSAPRGTNLGSASCTHYEPATDRPGCQLQVGNFLGTHPHECGDLVGLFAPTVIDTLSNSLLKSWRESKVLWSWRGNLMMR